MNFLKSFILIWIMIVISSIAFSPVFADVVIPTPTDPAVNPFLFYFSIAMSCLFAIDQALAAIPAIKANSTFQLIANIIKTLAGK